MSTSPMQAYKSYTPEDKAAMRALKEEVQLITGGDVKLGDLIMAVEPNMETPESLKAV